MSIGCGPSTRQSWSVDGLRLCHPLSGLRLCHARSHGARSHGDEGDDQERTIRAAARPSSICGCSERNFPVLGDHRRIRPCRASRCVPVPVPVVGLASMTTTLDFRLPASPGRASLIARRSLHPQIGQVRTMRRRGPHALVRLDGRSRAGASVTLQERLDGSLWSTIAASACRRRRPLPTPASCAPSSSLGWRRAGPTSTSHLISAAPARACPHHPSRDHTSRRPTIRGAGLLLLNAGDNVTGCLRGQRQWPPTDASA